MSFHEHLTTFAGRPVVRVPLDAPSPPPATSDGSLSAAEAARLALAAPPPAFPLPRPTPLPPAAVDGPVAWRFPLWQGEGAAVDEAWERFLTSTGDGVEALVIGMSSWGAHEAAPLPQLIEAAPRLPRLRSLFVGDVISEECEASWLRLGDIGKLIEAFPGLEELTVRGCEDLRTKKISHDKLRSLTVQCSGMNRRFVDVLLRSSLPALTHLELWLGTEEYRGDTTIEDLAPLLTGEAFPTVRSLGLRNSEIVDDLAAALSTAPIVPRLTRLDLSLGALTDKGAEALLCGRPLTHLDELDLHHHYLSDAMTAALPARLPTVRVDLSEQEEPDEDDEDETYYYIAVSE